jgi:hypothetical protein
MFQLTTRYTHLAIEESLQLLRRQLLLGCVKKKGLFTEYCGFEKLPSSVIPVAVGYAAALPLPLSG